MSRLFRISTLVAITIAPFATAEQLSIDIDFESGSGVVEKIDQDARVIRMSPSPHKGRGWDCWWFIRVNGITKGETITIDLGGGYGTWAQPDRATFSIDGKTWLHTSPGKRAGKRINYRQKIDATHAWFAWGPPFTPADANALVSRISESSPHAEAIELCKTREDRPVPGLIIKQNGLPDIERHGIWINARQHAWESGSSWVCRSLIEWLVGDDKRAETLRKKSIVYIIPIMDIDNVACGAGGKNQAPHDHNRDWQENPHWNSVKAAIQIINEMKRFDLFIDLHNPGRNDRQPFYYLPSNELISDKSKRNHQRFLSAAKAEITGPLKLAAKPRITGRNYDKLWRRISKNWIVTNTADHVVAVTLETSWNTPHSTTDGYMTVGRQQGLAIERYLRDFED